MRENNKPTAITSFLHEKRVFPPTKEFSSRAHIKSLAQYRKLYNESIKSPEKFWAKQAKNELVWFKPWKKVLQWKEPFVRWFVGGQLNVSHNCHDRWRLSSRHGDSLEEKRGRSVDAQGCERRFAGEIGRESHRAAAREQRGTHCGRARCLVASGIGLRERGMCRRKDGQRSAAVHPLHEWFERETERNSSHDRRLPARSETHAQIRLRHPGRGRLLVHRRRGLGDRP